MVKDKVDENKIENWLKQREEIIDQLEKVLETEAKMHYIASRDDLNVNIIRPEVDDPIIISGQISLLKKLESINEKEIEEFKAEIEPILKTTNGIYNFIDSEKNTVDIENAKYIYIENKLNEKKMTPEEFVNSIDNILKSLSFIREKIKNLEKNQQENF